MPRYQRITNDQVAGIQAVTDDYENVETFQDEPQEDADLNKKRHLLRQKEAQVESGHGQQKTRRMAAARDRAPILRYEAIICSCTYSEWTKHKGTP